MAHELYLTPEALAKLVFGNSSNTEKVYLTWEYMLFPNFPLNIGAHAQIGGFLVGNEIKEANKDTVNVPDYNYFGNVGTVVCIKKFWQALPSVSNSNLAATIKRSQRNSKNLLV